MNSPTPPLPSSPADESAEALPPTRHSRFGDGAAKAEALEKEGLSSPPFTPPPSPHRPTRPFLFVSGLAILILGILVGFLGTKVFNQSNNVSEGAATPSKKSSTNFSQLADPSTPTPDPTADWQTYRLKIISFKYPNDYFVDTLTAADGSITIYNVNPRSSKSSNIFYLSFRIDYENSFEGLIKKNPDFLSKNSKQIGSYLGYQVEGFAKPGGVKEEDYFVNIPDDYGLVSISLGNIPTDNQTNTKFVEFKKTVDQILSTFKFTDQTTDTSDWVTFQIGGTPYSVKHPPDVQKTGAGDFDIFIVNGKELRYRFLGNKENQTLEQYISTHSGLLPKSSISFSPLERVAINSLLGYKTSTVSRIANNDQVLYFLQDPRAQSFMEFSYVAVDASAETFFNKIIQTASYQP